MTNQELKKELSERILKKYNHLESLSSISFSGIEDNNIYFHTTFTIEEGVTITSQSDVQSNRESGLYGTRFYMKDLGDYHSLEIDESLIEPIIFGFVNNKENVLMALKTMSRVRTHINHLQGLLQEYTHNVILGNSAKDISDSIINELKITTALTDFKKQKV